jgi:hypothetical protein
VHQRERSVAALSLLIAAATIYTMLGAVRLVPLPSSLELVSRSSDAPGHIRAVVSGYYRTGPDLARGSASSAPYIFADSPAGRDWVGVYVSPQPDQRPRDGRLVVVIDTAIGLGSADSPHPIHAIAGYGKFVAAVIVGAMIAVGLAFWVAGTVVGLARRRV